MMSRVKTIFWKECVDNVRDRRSWTTVLVSALLGPLMLVLLIQVVGRTSAGASSKSTKLPVVGAELAPHLVSFLRNNNVEIQDPPANPEASVRDLISDLVMVIPSDYPEDFLEGRPATVRLIYDASRSRAGGDVSRVRELLRNYGLEIGAARLMARGISPQMVRALAVESTNLATPQSRASVLYSIVPMMLLIASLSGGMYIAIDTMAGERERGSLEPLLANPISPLELILGKLLATALFSGGTVIFTILGFGAVLNFVPLDVPGLKLGMTLMEGLLITALLLPVVVAGSAALILVSSHCRSFKEAQSAIQFVIMVPMIPGMLLQFVPVRPPLWTMILPTFSQDYLILNIMKGDPVATLEIAVSLASTLLLAIILTGINVYRYDRQRVLFAL